MLALRTRSLSRVGTWLCSMRSFVSRSRSNRVEYRKSISFWSSSLSQWLTVVSWLTTDTLGLRHRGEKHDFVLTWMHFFLRFFSLFYLRSTMSYPYPIKDQHAVNHENLSIHLSPHCLSNEPPSMNRKSSSPTSTSSLMSSSASSSSSSSSSSDSSQQMAPNRRAVKSCFWSTAIFSVNFVSSILVINLSKW